MTKIERDVVGVLCNQYYVSTKSMGDSSFIKDVRISAGAIANDDPRADYQRNDILNNYVMLPNIICSLATGGQQYRHSL